MPDLSGWGMVEPLHIHILCMGGLSTTCVYLRLSNRMQTLKYRTFIFCAQHILFKYVFNFNFDNQDYDDTVVWSLVVHIIGLAQYKCLVS